MKFEDEEERSVNSSEHHSSDRGDSGTSSDRGNEATMDEGAALIGKQETAAVWRIKFIVLLVLVASTSAVAATAYTYLSSNQEAQFRKQFQEDSSKVLAAIGVSLDKTFGLLDSVAVSWVSVARMTNQTWPFVTMPDFAVRMAKLVPLTDAMNLVILPIVAPDKRQAWEEYAAQNLDWINEGVKVQSEWSGYYGPTIYDWDPIPVISGDFGPLETNIRYEYNRVHAMFMHLISFSESPSIRL
jgi:hypothetical protein